MPRHVHRVIQVEVSIRVKHRVTPATGHREEPPTLRQAGSTSPKNKTARPTRHKMHAHAHTEQLVCSKDSHWWVYAIGVRVTDRCWGGAVIHIGWVPTCWVWIGCSKPAHTDEYTHKPKIKAYESMLSSCLSNYPQRVFQASLHHYGHSLYCG